MVNKGEFYLKGYFYEQKIEIFFNGKTIHLDANTNKIEKLEKLKTEESKFSETGILQISGLDDKATLLNNAINIKNLLSLGLGKRIIFDRQVYNINDACESIEKSMSKNENQGEQIIPDFKIKNYLKKTLPIWASYTENQKDDILIITDYLNQTRYDFIEDRVLRTVQAWECAANYWIKDIALSADLKELREKVKLAYNEWKKQTRILIKMVNWGKD